MENPIEICRHNINLLLDLIKKVVEQIGESPLARGDREGISHFETNYSNFKKRTTRQPIDIEAAIGSAKNAAIHAQSIGSGISNKKMYSEEVRSTAKTLENTAIAFIKVIDAGEEFAGPYKISVDGIDRPDDLNSGAGAISDHEKQIIELQATVRSEIETFERDIKKGGYEIEQLKRKSSEDYKQSVDEISELRRTIEQLKSNISNLHEEMVAESSKAAKVSEDAAEHSKKIHSQIDELLGQTASKVLLVDYANTADSEKKSADIMRNLSLGCMCLTGVVLCFALYESLSSGLDWKQAIFKAFTAIALSVPAAYLARESAKHRNQEHINRRISLDLRAITPYIATLPSEEQNKIKSEVASKIFGAQESGSVTSDNYPINVQELVKSIIEKIPAPK